MNGVFIIPDMVDPDSIYWLQPRREDLELDAVKVVVSHSSFVKLSDYTERDPTPRVPGKMWKKFESSIPGKPHAHLIGTWRLCWYGPPYPRKHLQYGTLPLCSLPILISQPHVNPETSRRGEEDRSR